MFLDTVQPTVHENRTASSIRIRILIEKSAKLRTVCTRDTEKAIFETPNFLLNSTRFVPKSPRLVPRKQHKKPRQRQEEESSQAKQSNTSTMGNSESTISQLERSERRLARTKPDDYAVLKHACKRLHVSDSSDRCRDTASFTFRNRTTHRQYHDDHANHE